MKNIKKRLTFKCWQCGRKFSLTKEFSGAPKLIVPCPFCAANCVADLAPYRRDTIEVVRSEADPAQTGITLDLPDPLPTIQPEEKIEH